MRIIAVSVRFRQDPNGSFFAANVSQMQPRVPGDPDAGLHDRKRQSELPVRETATVNRVLPMPKFCAPPNHL